MNALKREVCQRRAFVLNSINKKVHLKNEVIFCVNSRIDAQKSAPRVQV